MDSHTTLSTALRGKYYPCPHFLSEVTEHSDEVAYSLSKLLQLASSRVGPPGSSSPPSSPTPLSSGRNPSPSGWQIFILKFFLNFLKRFYLFIFRERGREGEREVEKHQCVVACHMAPSGDLACNPDMCPDWELNWRPFGSQPMLNPLSYTSQGHLLTSLHKGLRLKQLVIQKYES